MNPRIAAALNTLSMGLAELAEALAEAPAPAPAAPRAIPEQSVSTLYEDLPFAAKEAESEDLGRCPFHDRPWTVKAAGVSKAGKPYTAFYKCDAKDGDVFCPRKPVKAWVDRHPIAA